MAQKVERESDLDCVPKPSLDLRARQPPGFIAQPGENVCSWLKNTQKTGFAAVRFPIL